VILNTIDWIFICLNKNHKKYTMAARPQTEIRFNHLKKRENDNSLQNIDLQKEHLDVINRLLDNKKEHLDVVNRLLDNKKEQLDVVNRLLDCKEIDNYSGLLKLVHTAEKNICSWVKKYSGLILIVKDDERWQEERENSYASTLECVNILSNIFYDGKIK